MSVEKTRENYVMCARCKKLRPPRKMRAAGTVHFCKKHEIATGGDWTDGEEYISREQLRLRQKRVLLKAQVDAIDKGDNALARRVYALQKRVQNKGADPLVGTRIVKVVAKVYGIKVKSFRKEPVNA
jgi:hypothetical protein